MGHLPVGRRSNKGPTFQSGHWLDDQPGSGVPGPRHHDWGVQIMLLGRELSNVGEKAIVRRGGYSWRTHYRAGEYHRNLCTRWNLGDKGFVAHGVWNEKRPRGRWRSTHGPAHPLSRISYGPGARHAQAPPDDETPVARAVFTDEPARCPAQAGSSPAGAAGRRDPGGAAPTGQRTL